jgi:hypothetical protein
MSNDWYRSIQLLQILLFFLGERLAPGFERLIHPFNARESNYWARDTLVDPGQRDMAHLPVVLLGQLLHTLNGLISKPGQSHVA